MRKLSLKQEAKLGLFLLSHPFFALPLFLLTFLLLFGYFSDLGYELDFVGFVSLAGETAGLLFQNAQSASVSHPNAYSMGNGVLFPGVRQPEREVYRG